MLLTMMLYDEAITPQLCESLKKSLDVREDLTASATIVTGKFHTHRWMVTVSDPESFKRAMTKFSNTNERVGLYAEAVPPRETEQATSGESGTRSHMEWAYVAAKFFSPISRLFGQ